MYLYNLCRRYTYDNDYRNVSIATYIIFIGRGKLHWKILWLNFTQSRFGKNCILRWLLYMYGKTKVCSRSANVIYDSYDFKCQFYGTLLLDYYWMHPLGIPQYHINLQSWCECSMKFCTILVKDLKNILNTFTREYGTIIPLFKYLHINHSIKMFLYSSRLSGFINHFPVL